MAAGGHDQQTIVLQLVGFHGRSGMAHTAVMSSGRSVLIVVAVLMLQVGMFTCAATRYNADQRQRDKHHNQCACTRRRALSDGYCGYALDKEIDHKLGSVQDRDDLHAAAGGAGVQISTRQEQALGLPPSRSNDLVCTRGGAVCVGCVCVCVSW